MPSAQFIGVGKIPITLLRKQYGQLVRGRVVEAFGEEKINILANVQPAKYNDLLLLPESLRTKKSLRLYSSYEIRTLNEDIDGWPADEFIYKGERFVVFRVQHYEMGILDHYKAIAHRIELTK
jgi:hypothetical protein